MQTKARVTFLFLLLFSLTLMKAEVKLPNIFSNNMVIQRDQPIKIWGWADKNETVVVSFNNQVKKTKADKKGYWSTELLPVAYGGPYTLQVKGKKNTVTFDNILVGEVWLASGQSNMEWIVNHTMNAADEIKNANYPQIRSFNVAKNISMQPLDELGGSWEVCSPETVGSFSAVAYFFARNLTQQLNIPIGIINSSWGGTGIETWTSPEGVNQWPDNLKNQELIPKADNQDISKGQLNPNSYYSLLYNGMIHPVAKFRIKGAIWYQGEHNAVQAYNYRSLFPSMIQDWRSQWGYEFPFYWVQLANFMEKNGTPTDSDWAELREAQTMTLSVPQTGQAVITDIGDAVDIHPRNKQDVGLRLALIALNKDYGKSSVVYSGPTYKSMKIEGNKIIIEFNHADNGLLVKNKYGYVEGFTIAGSDRKFYWAKASIQENEIVVYSEQVPNPVAVRYSWENNPDVNLYNMQGLPAVSFRTDSWKGITQKN